MSCCAPQSARHVNKFGVPPKQKQTLNTVYIPFNIPSFKTTNKNMKTPMQTNHIPVYLYHYTGGSMGGGKGGVKGGGRTWFGRATHELLRGQQLLGPLRNTV